MNKEYTHAVLWTLGLAIVAWLLLRPKRQTLTAAGLDPVQVSIPTSGTPDYLIYNLPPASKPDTLPVITPLPNVPAAKSHTGGRGGGSCGCGCAQSNSLNSKLYPSLDALAASYTGQVDDLESKYLANILSAFPSLRGSGATVTNDGSGAQSGIVYSNIPQV